MPRKRTPAAPPVEAAPAEPPLEPAPAAGRAEPGQYLTFRLAGDDYAIPVLRTREILGMPSLTRVPTTPEWIRGVMNLRGSVVPVVDLAAKFGLPPTVASARTCVVLVELESEGEHSVMAVLADSVSQVVDLDADALEETPAFGTAVRPEFLQGLARPGDGERFALVLDVDRVLSADELLAAAATRDTAEAAESAARAERP